MSKKNMPFTIVQWESREKKGWASWTINFENPKLAKEFRNTFFTSRKKARAKAEDIFVNLKTNKHIHVEKRFTVVKAFAEFLQRKVDNGSCSQDHKNRCNHVFRLVVKFKPLGNMNCADVKPADLSDFYYSIKKTRTRKTLINHHSVIQKFFTYCFEQGYIYQMPTYPGMIRKLFEVNDSKQFNVESISEENIKLIKDSLFDDTFTQTMFLTAIKTGMRAGEQIALLWSDIDFDNESISITKNITEGEGTKADKLTDKGNVVGRVIPLHPDLKAQLMKWKMESPWSKPEDHVFIRSGERFTNWKRSYWKRRNKTTEQVVAKGKISPTSSYYQEGKLATYQTLRYMLETAIKESGAIPISWHSLRHYVASKLILTDGGSEKDLKRIATMLGHKTISTTQNVYAHFIALSNYKDTATQNLVANL